MNTFSPMVQTCSTCHSTGDCGIHAYYGRNIIDFIHEKPVRMEITILRLVCDNCGHTHAVLPDVIIPYSSYSLFFILRVLAESFIGFTSIERLCERFSITQNQFYKWLVLWNQHKQEWLGLLNSLEQSSIDFLKDIVVASDYSVFSEAFVFKFTVSFLQSHRNPAENHSIAAHSRQKGVDP